LRAPRGRTRRITRRFAIAGLLATAYASALQVAHADCSLSLVSRLPLTLSSSGLLVPVTLDGQPAQLIFDTGSFTSILSVAAANRIGLRHTRTEETDAVMATLGGIGGGRSAMGVTARTMDLGGLKGRDVNLLAADFRPALGDGLLSIDLISKYDVDLDFPDHQVILYEPIGDCRAPSAFLASPLYSVPLRPFGRDRRPRVTVSIGGQEVVAMLDTGAGHSAIFRQAAGRLGLHMDDLAADPHAHAAGVGPNAVRSVRHVFAPVTIGDLTFDHMSVDILDDHASDDVQMLLGADFQHAVHLWISYSSGTLIMQYPPRPSKKVP
jgi:predicted aspartyl protease